ncbi:hypothetical protein WR25_23751 [Diploscapter pachys]|uniref:CCR4-NOT transcription complex subunit 10 n=1 Tax=Diploscapter pachys TaxID=2018661 RepID=A0A2A2JFG0_9BILA|nr:hypothetical protein WR25_23751 [Diploscapter pachys]
MAIRLKTLNTNGLETEINGAEIEEPTSSALCPISPISADTVVEHMVAAQRNMEQLGRYEQALEHADKARRMCECDGRLNYLLGRCKLITAIAYGLKALSETEWETRKKALTKTVDMLEDTINADPHDYLAMYYSALYHAIVRDLEAARERCSRSLELNAEQPAAIMLLALIFTADGDLKSALELIVNALNEFPNNYGLLVLRLHIEIKFGRIDESLETSSRLFDFWRHRDAMLAAEEEKHQKQTKDGSTKTGTQSLGRELTPAFGLATSAGMNTLSASPSALDMSVVDSGIPASEAGGQSSGKDSESGQNATAANFTKHRSQSNIWMQLAELFLSAGRMNDFTSCIERAMSLFPHSPQAIYLKGRLHAARADKSLNDENLAKKLRAEAKACYLSALALSPSHVQTLAHLAKIYAQEGNLRMAEQMYKELVRVEPLCCDWWQELGCSLMRRGMSDRAVECFSTASQLDRTTPIIPFTAIPFVFPTSF